MITYTLRGKNFDQVPFTPTIADPVIHVLTNSDKTDADKFGLHSYCKLYTGLCKINSQDIIISYVLHVLNASLAKSRELVEQGQI